MAPLASACGLRRAGGGAEAEPRPPPPAPTRPAGDSQALPGYVSVYLQISDPGNSSSKWDCFASYRLSVRNLGDDAKSVHRDSWHRFSAKKKSHGWCDFAALSSILDAKQGFLGAGDSVQVSTDITILHESVAFSRESDLSGAQPSATGDVFSGRFVWRVHNFAAFQPLLRTQKIMSPGFPAGAQGGERGRVWMGGSWRRVGMAVT